MKVLEDVVPPISHSWPLPARERQVAVRAIPVLACAFLRPTPFPLHPAVSADADGLPASQCGLWLPAERGRRSAPSPVPVSIAAGVEHGVHGRRLRLGALPLIADANRQLPHQRLSSFPFFRPRACLRADGPKCGEPWSTGCGHRRGGRSE